MIRRAFFMNLVGSFSILVGIYSTPESRIPKRSIGEILSDYNSVGWDCYKDDRIMTGEWADSVRATAESWESLLKPGLWPKGMGSTTREIK